MPTPGPFELIIVLVIALLIFGPKKLPGLGRSLGSGMREFKDSITGGSKDDDDRSITSGSKDDDDRSIATADDKPSTPEQHDDDRTSRPRG